MSDYDNDGSGLGSKGFWGGLILGGIAAVVVTKLSNKNSAPPSSQQPRRIPQRPFMPGAAPFNQPVGAGQQVMNGIPIVPLPAESARRTQAVRRMQPPSMPQAPLPQGQRGAPKFVPGQGVSGGADYKETFGGGDGGLGGESF